MELSGSHSLIIKLENEDIATFKSLLTKITTESKQAGFKKLTLTEEEQDMINNIKEWLIE